MGMSLILSSICYPQKNVLWIDYTLRVSDLGTKYTFDLMNSGALRLSRTSGRLAYWTCLGQARRLGRMIPFSWSESCDFPILDKRPMRRDCEGRRRQTDGGR